MTNLCHLIAEGYVRARLSCESSIPLKSLPFLFCHQLRVFARDFEGRVSVDVGLVNEIRFEKLWANHQGGPPVRLVYVNSVTFIAGLVQQLFEIYS